MSAEIHCPKCSSANVILSKKHGAYVCEDCGHVLPEAPVSPLRIFLSYGHDANEPLVRRIKTDLEKRGHDVWFDKNDIRPGDNWRRCITEGILHCDRFVSFLSKHSTRDPGVCRDEIAISIGVKDGNIQTILVESEAEVQPPVSISHVQWLDMHDWKAGHGTVQAAKDQPATGDAAWESWYQGKLDEIRRIVESEQSRQFAGEIEKLNEYLKPIKSHARVKQLLEKGFFGRAWLFDAVENWRLSSSRDQRLFWITGDPGVGKSAFSAQLTHTRSDTVIAAQFVEWDKPDHRDARRVVRSLAFQLATRLPDYRKLLLTLPEIAKLDEPDPISKRQKNAAELFDYLLANPLRSVIGGGRERQLIVIDALDEAGEGGRNPLVEMLARHAPRLPDWLGLVVTSRPVSAVHTPLQGLNPFVLDTRTEANRADLRDYLRQKLAPQLRGRPDADRLIGQILEKSEGVFLYVEHFCDDVQHDHLSLDRPEQFPQGLGGIFCQWFQRQFPDEEQYEKTIEPMLGAILAAREPLPVEILQKLFDWRETELRKWLRKLGSLFPVTNEANGEVIKPYHKSLADWLTDETKAGAHFVSLREGHRLLARACHLEYDRADPERMSRYALRYLCSHLWSTGDSDQEGDKVFADTRYMSCLIERCGIARLVGDGAWLRRIASLLQNFRDPASCFLAGRIGWCADDSYYVALGYYARGICHVTASGNRFERELLRSEEKWLTEVRTGQQVSRPFRWLAELISLAQQTGHGSKAKSRLPKAIIVLGGNYDNDYSLESLGKLLKPTFRAFDGKVISSGTTGGVSGCLADIASELAVSHAKNFCLVGYLPSGLPYVSTDRRYDQLRFCGDEFSAEQTLKIWKDLFSEGIPAEAVLCLGFGGGALCALDYRVALALGAKVVLGLRSGRAADALLADPLWSDLPNLLSLPMSEESYRQIL